FAVSKNRAGDGPDGGIGTPAGAWSWGCGRGATPRVVILASRGIDRPAPRFGRADQAIAPRVDRPDRWGFASARLSRAGRCVIRTARPEPKNLPQSRKNGCTAALFTG